MKIKYLFLNCCFFCVMLLINSCGKNTESFYDPTKNITAQDGQVVFWISSNYNTPGSYYNLPVTIYNSAQTQVIVSRTVLSIQPYSSSPGCGGGGTFSLPAGSYSAYIEYTGGGQWNPFYITQSSCTSVP